MSNFKKTFYLICICIPPLEIMFINVSVCHCCSQNLWMTNKNRMLMQRRVMRMANSLYFRASVGEIFIMGSFPLFMCIV